MEGVNEDEEDASSRASSPSKSPMLQGASPFLADQPLARQPPGARAGARLSQQGLGGGLGLGGTPASGNAQRRPGLPAAWQQQEGLAGGGGGGGGLFGGGGTGLNLGMGQGAAPSDPMTYQMAEAQLDKDGVPNMGDVQEEEQAGGARMRSQAGNGGGQQQQWHIPAVHTTPGSASRGGGRRTGQLSAGGGGKGRLGDKKPGAAFKLGKRQAYLKYLAYEVGGSRC